MGGIAIAMTHVITAAIMKYWHLGGTTMTEINIPARSAKWIAVTICLSRTDVSLFGVLHN